VDPRWRKVSDRTRQTRRFNYLSLTSLRATLLTVVIQQRVFLTGYAAGLRAGDQDRIDRAFKDLARADDMLALARKYVNLSGDAGWRSHALAHQHQFFRGRGMQRHGAVPLLLGDPGLHGHGRHLHDLGRILAG